MGDLMSWESVLADYFSASEEYQGFVLDLLMEDQIDASLRYGLVCHILGMGPSHRDLFLIADLVLPELQVQGMRVEVERLLASNAELRDAANEVW